MPFFLFEMYRIEENLASYHLRVLLALSYRVNGNRLSSVTAIVSTHSVLSYLGRAGSSRPRPDSQSPHDTETSGLSIQLDRGRHAPNSAFHPTRWRVTSYKGNLECPGGSRYIQLCLAMQASVPAAPRGGSKTLALPLNTFLRHWIFWCFSTEASIY